MFCPSRLFRAAATTATELPHLETFPGAACLPTHRAAIWQSDSPPGVRSAQQAACLFRSPKFRAAQIEKRLHGSFQFQPPEPAHPLTIVRLGAPFSYGICRLHGESRREPWSAASLARPGGEPLLRGGSPCRKTGAKNWRHLFGRRLPGTTHGKISTIAMPHFGRHRLWTHQQ